MNKNQKYTLFAGIALVNAVVLYVGSILFPTDIVLGNSTLSPLLAAIVTGILLSVVMTLPEPTIQSLKWKIKNEMYWMLIYLAANIAGLWLLARLANFSGFGVTSYMVIIVLGFVLNLLQYGVWKVVSGKK